MASKEINKEIPKKTLCYFAKSLVGIKTAYCIQFLLIVS